MSIGLLVFLFGLFVVPILLLWFGHRLRRRSARARAVFWGALVGHCIAGVLAIAIGMLPPEAWTSDETLRGFAGLWSLAVFPFAGALVGAVLSRGPTS